MFTTHFARLTDGAIESDGTWSPTINAHLLRAAPGKFRVDISHFDASVIHPEDWYAVSLATSPYSDDPDGGQVNLYLSPAQARALHSALTDVLVTTDTATTK